MRVLIMPFVILCPLCVSAADGSSTKPEALSLWNGPAPIGDGTTEDVDVRVTLHRPAKPNGTAIVICPGGGYGGLVTGGEGHGIAKWLNGHGITGLVGPLVCSAARRPTSDSHGQSKRESLEPESQ